VINCRTLPGNSGRDYDLWLEPGMEDAARLSPVFAPFPLIFVAHPVSTSVNSPAIDKPDCIQEVA